MMRPKRIPPSRERGRVSKMFCSPAEPLEHIANTARLQAHFLASRFGVAPATAAAIASLAFGPAREAAHA